MKTVTQTQDQRIEVKQKSFEETKPEGEENYFTAHLVVNNFEIGSFCYYDDVQMYLFKRGEEKSPEQYQALIKDWTLTPENERESTRLMYAMSFVDCDLFTSEEISEMEKYFSTLPNTKFIKTPFIDFPVDNLTSYGSNGVGGREAIHEFHNDEGYPLNFKVQAWYDYTDGTRKVHREVLLERRKWLQEEIEKIETALNSEPFKEINELPYRQPTMHLCF